VATVGLSQRGLAASAWVLPIMALSIGFTRSMIIHSFGCLAKKSVAPRTWDDPNKPELSSSTSAACAKRRHCPKAQLIGFKTRDECTLALQSGWADAHIQVALLGLSTVGENRALDPYYLLGNPTVALPSCLGLQWEPDTRFREVIDA
jgi:polar amino acid transport system substrate-binding protein